VPRDVTRLGKGVVALVTGTIASSRAVERPLVRVDINAARLICITGGKDEQCPGLLVTGSVA
jgi:hypothetical protein